jgi:hypothetical protein
MLVKGLIHKVVTKDDYPIMSDPIVQKMLNNPEKFIQESPDIELVYVFPICQGCLNKVYKGKLDKYRKGLLKSLRIGSMRFEPDDGFGN